jgi:DNA ligase (NAD+)
MNENRVEEVKSLVKKLNKYRDEYYNNNNSIISDREYDELFDKLIVLERETGCIFSNSPTQSVGYMSLSQLQKVKHSHPLLSLGKTTDIDEFIKYFGNKDFLIMAKLDGLTCSLTYDNGKLIRAESRGDGETGEDITHNAKVFSNLPTEIPFKGKLEIDGECIITYDEFERIKARENTKYKNPRNLVSGSVRQLNSEIAAKRNIKFIAWRLHEAENVGIQYHSEGFDFLSNLGFDVVPYYTNSFNTIEWIKDECETKQIPIDGIVGMFDDIEYGNSLGRTGHHPRHSLAYKFYQEENETVLLNIEWSTSRTGLVNPVAIFEPVEIDGTTVSRATLNNVSIIKELELGIGDIVTVVKANQIIPKITQNLTRSNTYQIPSVCPSCGNPVTIKNDNGREMLYCTNRHCKAILHDKISNFATREAMNIVGISEERLRSLMDMGYITSFESLYHLKDYRNEIAKAKGFGESSIDKIINAIEVSKKCQLINIIIAIGIPGIGKSAARTIAEYCEETGVENTFQEFINFAMSGFDWSVLQEIGQATSDNINSYVVDNYEDIQPLVNILHIKKPQKSDLSQRYKDKTFCITGKLVEFDNRNALVYDIEAKGGTVVSSVTSKTQYLITNDKTSGSSKNKAAEKYGTKIISELEYIMGNF